MSDENQILVTTQATSKRLKGHLLICWIVFIGSMMYITGFDEENPTTMDYIASFAIFGALIWWVVTKCRIWWNHK